MRTMLLAAAIAAALAIPVVLYREPPAPLETAPEQEEPELDAVIEMAASGCEPSMQTVEGGGTLIRLCPQAR